MEWKRFILAMALVLSLLCGAACAEDLTSILIDSRTSQSFTDEAVPDEDLNTILQAGLAATSAINQQPWFFVAVSNQEVLSEINGSAGGFSGAAPAGMPEGEGASSGAQADGEGASSGAPADGEGASSGAPADGEGASSGAPAGGMPAGGAKAGMGDSPVAIIVYMNSDTSSPNAAFDCGLATENMFIAAKALGYGAKIVSSPTMQLNGTNHDTICEKLGVDKAYSAVAVLLIGRDAAGEDGVTSASVRNSAEEKVSIVK